MTVHLRCVFGIHQWKPVTTYRDRTTILEAEIKVRECTRCKKVQWSYTRRSLPFDYPWLSGWPEPPATQAGSSNRSLQSFEIIVDLDEPLVLGLTKEETGTL